MPKTPATKRTKRTAVAAGILAVAIGSAAIPSHSQSAGPDASAAQATTHKDRTDLSLTVYNAGIALVRDVRNIQLQSGVAPLRFEDVSASINPVTVHFRSLTDA